MILCCEDDGEYYFVILVEKWCIDIEDMLLLVYLLFVVGQGEEQVIILIINVGEMLDVGFEYLLEVICYLDFEELRFLLYVCYGLIVRLVMVVYYDLVDYVVECEVVDGMEFGVYSYGNFYKIGQGG